MGITIMYLSFIVNNAFTFNTVPVWIISYMVIIKVMLSKHQEEEVVVSCGEEHIYSDEKIIKEKMKVQKVSSNCLVMIIPSQNAQLDYF